MRFALKENSESRLQRWIYGQMTYFRRRGYNWCWPGFPTWGTCTPRGTFAYPKGYI